MWKLAAEKKIKNFTGYDAVYETPNNPDLIIDTEHNTIRESYKILDNYIGGIQWTYQKL